MDYIEKYKLQRVPLKEAEELQRLLPQFGLTNFIYTVHFLGERLVGGASRKQVKQFSYLNTSPNQALKMNFVSSDDERFISLMADFFHNFARFNPEFASSALGTLYFPKQEGKSARFSKVFQRFKSININSAVYYQSPDPERGCIGNFVLYSNYDRDKLVDQLIPQQVQLKAILDQYHRLFYVSSPLRLNPWRNLNVVSPVCCDILQMLSEGASTAKVAEQLFLSRRGVDYHLDNAKALLNASNRSHLIAKAVAYGIVDSSRL